MTKKETNMLEAYIIRSEAKEEKRKILRNRIVKSLDRIENDIYDDTDSSNKGLITRVNDLDEAVKEIANLVRRTKIRNEVILGIIGAMMMAVLSQLLSHYIKIF